MPEHATLTLTLADESGTVLDTWTISTDDEDLKADLTPMCLDDGPEYSLGRAVLRAIKAAKK